MEYDEIGVGRLAPYRREPAGVHGGDVGQADPGLEVELLSAAGGELDDFAVGRGVSFGSASVVADASWI